MKSKLTYHNKGRTTTPSPFHKISAADVHPSVPIVQMGLTSYSTRMNRGSRKDMNPVIVKLHDDFIFNNTATRIQKRPLLQ